MRITAGTLRGRALKTPAGLATRPTADRVRQAVFNILEHAKWAPSLRDARVLDLFAGSGALGFEAVSRGAALALFVETDAAARGAIRDNQAALDLFGRTRIHRCDATELGAPPASVGGPFDLAFLDPPYRKGLGERSLASLRAGGWLAGEALCVLERAADEPPLMVEGFTVLDSRRYGAAQIAFLRPLAA